MKFKGILISDDISMKALKFDLIMIIHAFTHVIDIDEMVHQIGKRLKPGGLVYVEVPGIVNWNFAKKFKKSVCFTAFTERSQHTCCGSRSHERVHRITKNR